MHLTTVAWLPASRDAVFSFFADARNLERLTPPWLHFRILTAGPIDMRTGAHIDYRILLHGIPLRWQSVISHWDPPRQFIDEQISGPYRRWVHTHTFEPENGGTRVSDAVEFDVIASWLTGWFVMRDLRKIFAYRHETLIRIFADQTGR
jgi:ligand-binding SRPBCC domain-containing protein